MRLLDQYGGSRRPATAPSSQPDASLAPPQAVPSTPQSSASTLPPVFKSAAFRMPGNPSGSVSPPKAATVRPLSNVNATPPPLSLNKKSGSSSRHVDSDDDEEELYDECYDDSITAGVQAAAEPAAETPAPVPPRAAKPSATETLLTSEWDEIDSMTAAMNAMTAGLDDESASDAVWYMAECEYTPSATAVDKLPLDESDMVEVLIKDPGGWWLARRGTEEGWVPADFLVEADGPTLPAPAFAAAVAAAPATPATPAAPPAPPAPPNNFSAPLPPPPMPSAAMLNQAQRDLHAGRNPGASGPKPATAAKPSVAPKPKNSAEFQSDLAQALMARKAKASQPKPALEPKPAPETRPTLGPKPSLAPKPAAAPKPAPVPQDPPASERIASMIADMEMELSSFGSTDEAPPARPPRNDSISSLAASLSRGSIYMADDSDEDEAPPPPPDEEARRQTMASNAAPPPRPPRGSLVLGVPPSDSTTDTAPASPPPPPRPARASLVSDAEIDAPPPPRPARTSLASDAEGDAPPPPRPARTPSVSDAHVDDAPPPPRPARTPSASDTHATEAPPPPRPPRSSLYSESDEAPPPRPARSSFGSDADMPPPRPARTLSSSSGLGMVDESDAVPPPRPARTLSSSSGLGADDEPPPRPARSGSLASDVFSEPAADSPPPRPAKRLSTADDEDGSPPRPPKDQPTSRPRSNSEYLRMTELQQLPPAEDFGFDGDMSDPEAFGDPEEEGAEESRGFYDDPGQIAPVVLRPAAPADKAAPKSEAYEVTDLLEQPPRPALAPDPKRYSFTSYMSRGDIDAQRAAPGPPVPLRDYDMPRTRAQPPPPAPGMDIYDVPRNVTAVGGVVDPVGVYSAARPSSISSADGLPGRRTSFSGQQAPAPHSPPPKRNTGTKVSLFRKHKHAEPAPPRVTRHDTSKVRTLSDTGRIALMTMVKDGQLTIDQAITWVEDYECGRVDNMPNSQEPVTPEQVLAESAEEPTREPTEEPAPRNKDDAYIEHLLLGE